MAQDISNIDDMIDIRDVIARIEELRDERGILDNIVVETEEEASTDENQLPALVDARQALTDWLKENGDELTTLEAFLEECKGNGGDEQYQGDWYPVTAIRDDYFQDYAQELAEDIGAIGKDLPWPACHIDWEAAAEALQQDYTSVEFDGITYWVR